MASRIPFLIASAIMGAVSIPLILRLIGPNSVYGFRTPFTQSNPEVWYPANVFAGWALLIAAGLSAIILWRLPSSLMSRSWIPLLSFVGPVAVALLASFLYLRRLS